LLVQPMSPSSQSLPARPVMMGVVAGPPLKPSPPHPPTITSSVLPRKESLPAPPMTMSWRRDEGLVLIG
jgi:hypothetical protein